MSGQYPPPNPAHPFTRPPLHQRASPGLPPWGHPPQNPGMNIGSSMNFYGSPHLELPNRGLQQWSHPKPSPPSPLFSLPRPLASVQQEETMDLSNTRLDTNGTEVNGEVKDSVVSATSVIAANPLRDSYPAAAGSCDSREHPSFVKSILKPTNVTDTEISELNKLSNRSGCSNISFLENPTFHSNVGTLTGSGKGDDQPYLDSFISKSIGNISNKSQSFDPPSVSDSQRMLDSSAISVDTDDSKLVMAESSAEDIFDDTAEKSDAISLKNESNFTPQSSQDTNKSNAEDVFGSPEKHDSVFSTSQITNRTDDPCSVAESTLNETQKSTTTLESNDQWLSKSPPYQAPVVSEPEPHPSVENVETLLESMFNSQEETSCSSQNSNSSLVPSVIVTNGARLSVPVEVSKAQDVISPMQAEELALTLAEDHISEEIIKEEKKEQKIQDDLMDEIEKKLEMLTESSSSDQIKTNIHSKAEPFIKLETNSTTLTEENVVSVLMSDDVTPTVNKVDDLKSEVGVKDSQVTKIIKDEEHLEVEAGTSLIKVESEILTTKTEKGTSSNPFIEVESELEKMFAGIVEPTEEANSDNASQPSTSDSKKLTVNKRTATKRKKPNSRRPSDNSTFEDTTPVKKKGRKRMNDSGSERGSKKFKVEGSETKRGRPSKETNGDMSKVKGPFVHIEGSKLSPASVVVVNSGVRVDDDDAADKISGRRKHSVLQRSEGGNKKPGPVYSSSAMSARYNSDKADLTWVCVFCKRGPHCAGGLGGQPAGDLFGPYRIPTLPPHDDVLPSGTVADKDLVEEQKRRGGGGKYPKSIRASGGADHFIQKMAKKSKRSGSLDSVEGQTGLLLLDGSYEVWVHEQCAEWAPGLCIIGTQLVGLEDAVWTALRTRCSQCGEKGANVGCVVHNCPTRVHYPCAVVSGWLLDTDTFIARCHNHRTRLRHS